MPAGGPADHSFVPRLYRHLDSSFTTRLDKSNKSWVEARGGVQEDIEYDMLIRNVWVKTEYIYTCTHM